MTAKRKSCIVFLLIGFSCSHASGFPPQAEQQATQSFAASPQQRNADQEQDDADDYGATVDVANRAECEANGGYWHNGKCWKNFDEDAGIPNDKIDEFVAEQLELIKQAKISIGEDEHQIEFAYPEIEDGEATLAIGFDNMKQFLLVECSEDDLLNGGKFKADAVHALGNLLEANDETELDFVSEGRLQISVNDDFEISIKGKLKQKSGEEKKVRAFVNEAMTGAGNSTLEIKGEHAFLSGTLGTLTYPQIGDLIENHPDIKTVTLTEVDGSVFDAVNMHTGRILREAGLNARVLPTSEIASGGVDLFCAGIRRFASKGAKIGVHSWGDDEITGADLSPDHPDHQFQVNYFGQMLGPELGRKFYFYTLEAAPYDDIHWMNTNELTKWKVVTDWTTMATEKENTENSEKTPEKKRPDR